MFITVTNEFFKFKYIFSIHDIETSLSMITGNKNAPKLEAFGLLEGTNSHITTILLINNLLFNHEFLRVENIKNWHLSDRIQIFILFPKLR